MLAFLPSITATNVVNEHRPSYGNAGQLSLYIGLLAGALFWGITADAIGRKWAFNTTLLLTSIFAIAAGAAPNYTSWAAFNALSAFGAGGNLVLDTTIFLEYLPRSKTWLVTLMAAWWGIGTTIAGLIAWGFLRKLPTQSPVSLATPLTIVRQPTTAAPRPMKPAPDQTTWGGDTFISPQAVRSLSQASFASPSFDSTKRRVSCSAGMMTRVSFASLGASPLGTDALSTLQRPIFAAADKQTQRMRPLECLFPR